MSVKINPHKAYLTRDTEMMSQMDPFIELTLGSQKFKTKTLQEGGKKVFFEQQFTFKREGDNMLKVTVYDEDQTTNDEVGTNFIDLTPYFNGKSGQETISIKYDDKPAGKVLLRIVQPHMSIQDVSTIKNRNEPIKFYTPQDIMRELMGMQTLDNKNVVNQLFKSHNKTPPPPQFNRNSRFTGGYYESLNRN